MATMIKVGAMVVVKAALKEKWRDGDDNGWEESWL